MSAHGLRRYRSCCLSKCLDDADVDTLLEQVKGEGMSQRVWAHSLVILGVLGCFLHSAVQLTDRD